MKSNASSKRPPPDEYDDLWLLLPVFLLFLALCFSFADTVPGHGPKSGHSTDRAAASPAPSAPVEEVLNPAADPSVPPASAAVTADSMVEAREIAAF
jgi:hypothetical protein